MRDDDTEAGSRPTRAIFSSDDTVEHLSDRANRRGFLPGERKAINRYFRKPHGDVLDVGCGAGRVANLLYRQGFTVTGTDISKPLIQRAQAAFPEIEFLVDDITDSALNGDSFDYAIFSDVGIDYIAPEQQRVESLRELYRVLRPGGVLIFSSHNSWSVVANAVTGEFSKLVDLYVRNKEHNGFFSRYKTESVNFGKQRVYFSNPLRQRRQLRKSGFTFVDLVGKRESPIRYLERSPLYIAKK